MRNNNVLDGTEKETVKFSVDMSKALYDNLTKNASGSTKADVIRDALDTYFYLRKEVLEKNCKVFLGSDYDKLIKEVVFRWS